MPEATRRSFQLEPARAEPVRGDLWTPASSQVPTGRAVVICHGFKGFKDWGFFPHAAQWLSEAIGCPVATFNFAGCGVGADLENFTEPEAFGRSTFSKETRDLSAVLEGLEAGRLGEAHFPAAGRIGVLGHSRGGVAAILAGERASVRAVVTWASIATVERYAALFDGLRADEAASVRNARTGDVLPLYRDVLDDIHANRERFDLEASLRRSGVPLLVIHGTGDASVPPDDARRLAVASDHSRLELIEGAGHTFGVGHPFEGPSPELEAALEMTARHFEAHL